MTIFLHNLPLVVISALVLALAGIALSRAERMMPRGGGAYPAMPLSLMLSNLLSWVALILTGLAAVMLFGILYPVIAAGLIAAALFEAPRLGADLTRFYPLRLPAALASLAITIGLWLTTLLLIMRDV